MCHAAHPRNANSELSLFMPIILSTSTAVICTTTSLWQKQRLIQKCKKLITTFTNGFWTCCLTWNRWNNWNLLRLIFACILADIYFHFRGKDRTAKNPKLSVELLHVKQFTSAYEFDQFSELEHYFAWIFGGRQCQDMRLETFLCRIIRTFKFQCRIWMKDYRFIAQNCRWQK